MDVVFYGDISEPTPLFPKKRLLTQKNNA